MTPLELVTHNFLARAVHLLVALRDDLLKYPNDSAASGFVCDINDFFSETYSWLKERERASLNTASPSSAPPAATSGVVWIAPTPTSGPQSSTTADSTPSDSSPTPAPPVPSFESPVASSTRRSTSLWLDFF